MRQYRVLQQPSRNMIAKFQDDLNVLAANGWRYACQFDLFILMERNTADAPEDVSVQKPVEPAIVDWSAFDSHHKE